MRASTDAESKYHFQICFRLFNLQEKMTFCQVDRESLLKTRFLFVHFLSFLPTWKWVLLPHLLGPKWAQESDFLKRWRAKISLEPWLKFKSSLNLATQALNNYAKKVEEILHMQTQFSSLFLLSGPYFCKDNLGKVGHLSPTAVSVSINTEIPTQKFQATLKLKISHSNFKIANFNWNCRGVGFSGLINLRNLS